MPEQRKGRQFPDDRFVSGTEAAGGPMAQLSPDGPWPASAPVIHIGAGEFEQLLIRGTLAAGDILVTLDLSPIEALTIFHRVIDESQKHVRLSAP